MSHESKEVWLEKGGLGHHPPRLNLQGYRALSSDEILKSTWSCFHFLQPTYLPINISVTVTGLMLMAENYFFLLWKLFLNEHMTCFQFCWMPFICYSHTKRVKRTGTAVKLHRIKSWLACLLSRFSLVRLFSALWTTVRQAPQSVGFSRQENWSGLPCPPLGDLPNSGIEPVPLTAPALTGRFFTTSTTWDLPLTSCVIWES